MNFPDKFSQNSQILNFMIIRPVGAELLHGDRRTDMTNLRVTYRNFAKAPKNFTQDLGDKNCLLLRHNKRN
jgi:hypothetical protein